MTTNDTRSDSDYVNALIYILTLLYILFRNNGVYAIHSCATVIYYATSINIEYTHFWITRIFANHSVGFNVEREI